MFTQKGESNLRNLSTLDITCAPPNFNYFSSPSPPPLKTNRKLFEGRNDGRFILEKKTTVIKYWKIEQENLT